MHNIISLGSEIKEETKIKIIYSDLELLYWCFTFLSKGDSI